MNAIMTQCRIIPFPLDRVRPPLLRCAQLLAQTACSDQKIALWDCLPSGHQDRISPADLMAMLPACDRGRDGTIVAAQVADFAVLGLFAIHTGQWMREDLLNELNALRLRAEGLQKTRLAAQA